MCRCNDTINVLKCAALRSTMTSKHSAGIYARGKLIVNDAFNFITGQTLNCHAEQSALMKLLKLHGLRRPSQVFNFSKPLLESDKRCFI